MGYEDGYKGELGYKTIGDPEGIITGYPTATATSGPSGFITAD